MSLRYLLLFLAAACSQTGDADKAEPEVPPSRIEQPREPVPTVAGSAPSVPSRAEDVTDLILRRTPRASRCYEDSPHGFSTLRVELRLRVRTTGEVSVDEVTTDAADDAAVRECLHDVFESAYVQPVQDEVVEVRPLVFRPRTGGNEDE